MPVQAIAPVAQATSSGMNVASAIDLPASEPSADDARSWNPKTTLIFVVGVLKWQDKGYEQFTGKSRRDAILVDFFRSHGVPESNIVYLQDENATLKNFNERFDDLLQRSNEGDTLMFYYCGHGWLDKAKNGYYANYDVTSDENAISTNKIAQKLKENFHGSQALIFADCCHSGSIGNALRKRSGEFSFGMVTSASQDESSTSNWTFSQALLDAFNGHKFVDENADGKISFTDFAKYVTQEMKQIDNQVAGVASGNGFSQENFCFGKVQFPDETIPRLVEVRWNAKWWKAKLLEIREGEARIRWAQIGYDTPEDDEWFNLIKLREINGKPLNGLAPATARSEFNVGDSVQVLWRNEFYPAHVLTRKDNLYFIHYDGYGDNWDEWVDLSSMK